MTLLYTCQCGFEQHLKRELESVGHSVQESSDGWVLAQGSSASRAAAPELCFAHAALVDPVTICGQSAQQLAAAIVDHFMHSSRDHHFAVSWPVLFRAAAPDEGVAKRTRAVEGLFRERLAKTMSRVAKLATPPLWVLPETERGLFAVLTAPDAAHVGLHCRLFGQRRMKDDPQAPSRSYLKVEEAYGILGRSVTQGETVVDLGAAPGGWSYSAARRGGSVTAVDNGPLKDGAAGHPHIAHTREDAFTFRPSPGVRYDWLFCDMVEDPYRVLDIVRRWLHEGWCRSFVVNLKFGRTDPVALVELVRDRRRGIAGQCATVTVRHLYHDREEITVVGSAR